MLRWRVGGDPDRERRGHRDGRTDAALQRRGDPRLLLVVERRRDRTERLRLEHRARLGRSLLLRRLGSVPAGRSGSGRRRGRRTEWPESAAFMDRDAGVVADRERRWPGGLLHRLAWLPRPLPPPTPRGRGF